MNQFTHLESPTTIRGKVYGNRLIVAPTLLTRSIFFLPEIAENVYRMVESRVKGGFAVVSMGELSVNNEEGTTLLMERAIDMDDYDGEGFKKIREYVDRIRKHGVLAYLEFSHEGAVAETKASYVPQGPDAYVREDGAQVFALNPVMMEKICNDYRKISKLTKVCGLDGVLIHGGHGLNMQQFISPWVNHRTDEFGGSVENRIRFSKMIPEAVREGIGEDMILELCMSAEGGANGGTTIDDMIESYREIDGMADIIHVSNGLKWAGNQTQTSSDFFDVYGVSVEYAAKAKAAIIRSKVAVTGGINDPASAGRVIADGKADFTEPGRQGLADPEFPNKAFSGGKDAICKCVRCSSRYPGFCEHRTDVFLWEKGLSKEDVDRIYSPASMGRHAISPNSGFGQYEDWHPHPTKSRNVLITGGGVGGLQAAITARKRGYKVTLLEKTGELGGTTNFTDYDKDKEDLRNFKNLLIYEAGESGAGEAGADIRLDTVCSRGIMDECKPNAVIIATGARPIKSSIRGTDQAMNTLEAHHNMDKIGKRAVLAGGGLVGCEVGLHLANHGHEVTMIEMQGMMALETPGYYRDAFLDEMDWRGLKQMLYIKVLELTDKGVPVETDGEQKPIAADICVYSMGMKVGKVVVEEIREMAGGIRTYVIGDCDRVGKAGDAVHAGHEMAVDIV